jgi:hypothetical protein
VGHVPPTEKAPSEIDAPGTPPADAPAPAAEEPAENSAQAADLEQVEITAYVKVNSVQHKPGDVVTVQPATAAGLVSAGYARRP